MLPAAGNLFRVSVHCIDHPLAGHLLAGLRNQFTEPAEFRRLAHNLTTVLVLEATRNVSTTDSLIETPLETANATVLGQELAAVPILRAGLGMLQPVTDLFPDVAVGYIGLERNEATAVASSYYCKLPSLEGKFTILLDPMLATGGSASQAIDLLKSRGGKKIVMVCIVASPDGIALLSGNHPDVEIYTSAVDRELNHKKYILPGLGDFGDRLYGTFERK